MEICKNNQEFIFNGRLGDDCGVGKSTTPYCTTIDYFLGSPSVMQLVETFKVLDFDPMVSDVHCGLHTKFIFKCLSKETNVKSDTQVVLECVKPGKWNTGKKSDYVSQINEGKINELIEKAQFLAIDDINMEFKQILIESALKVFSAN